MERAHQRLASKDHKKYPKRVSVHHKKKQKKCQLLGKKHPFSLINIINKDINHFQHFKNC